MTHWLFRQEIERTEITNQNQIVETNSWILTLIKYSLQTVETFSNKLVCFFYKYLSATYVKSDNQQSIQHLLKRLPSN